jgi:hypothetical protein
MVTAVKDEEARVQRFNLMDPNLTCFLSVLQIYFDSVWNGFKLRLSYMGMT